MMHTCKLFCPWVKHMEGVNQLTAPHHSSATLWGFNLQKNRHILRYSSEPDVHLVEHTVRFTHYVVGLFILELKKHSESKDHRQATHFPKQRVCSCRGSRVQLPPGWIICWSSPFILGISKAKVPLNSGTLPKFIKLFLGSLSTFPENDIKIHS